jgi:hypothetical protein
MLVKLYGHLIHKLGQVGFELADQLEGDVSLLVSEFFVQLVDFMLHLCSALVGFSEPKLELLELRLSRAEVESIFLVVHLLNLEVLELLLMLDWLLRLWLFLVTVCVFVHGAIARWAEVSVATVTSLERMVEICMVGRHSEVGLRAFGGSSP